MTSRDVQEREFVCARRIIRNGGLNRVTSVTQIDEVDAFDDPAVLDVKTGNDTDFEHDWSSRRGASKEMPG